ncbi:MAG: twin-arginine translocation signal domain-containing protein, partial [Candidatus Aminicenantes bacterium]|nr:twin-arginine translocation signal domain-containing protein [Candidatus Aminicenantes bacterium]
MIEGKKARIDQTAPVSRPDCVFISRRQFIKTTGTAVASLAIVQPKHLRGSQANSKIKLGLVGCGG